MRLSVEIRVSALLQVIFVPLIPSMALLPKAADSFLELPDLTATSTVSQSLLIP